MAIIKAQKIPRKEIEPDDILARFCFYFPRYTYSEAQKLPYKRVVLLLRTVDREHAKKMIDMLRIVVSPHTKNGEQVKELLNEFKDRLG